jgi:hypothetical protein
MVSVGANLPTKTHQHVQYRALDTEICACRVQEWYLPPFLLTYCKGQIAVLNIAL